MFVSGPRLVVFVLVAVLVSGCTAAAPAPRHHPAGASVGGSFNGTDVAWLQLAEALHTRALPLLELAPGRTASRPLADLAARIGRKHQTGRGRLRALLAEARVGGENPHAAHDMPGMPTAADLRALKGLRDDAFDRRFSALLRVYLDQLVLVARGEQNAGGASSARELAAAMERAHVAELAALDGIGVAAG
ncbi:DUF305 domain-containing protein [Nonomuraea sp. NPDC046802]|uniref:DUF305 domain-containing protein n=1 Tax=Nonomuraea sp. NPDC046802 TaxID=3154919 RepID=UPI0033C530B3